MEYQVMWVEDRTTATGKSIKSLTLQGKGSRYPDKFVTMFSDHPLFSTIAAGQTIEGELQITDSKKINPNSGQPYKNKTLLKPGQVPAAPKTAPQSSENDARTYNHLVLRIEPMLQKILAWQDRRDVLDGVEPEKKALPNSDPDEIDQAFEDAIRKEDIPF